MHYIESVAAEVEKTHPGLGALAAVALISSKARKLLLVISPAGCGKSVTGKVIAQNHPQVIFLDVVTRAGLSKMDNALDHFSGVYIMDDLGKMGSVYLRVETLSTFAELCYTGFMKRQTITSQVDIEGYAGSAIINCQPTVLRRVIQHNEWEATIADKAIRYYHLYRPLHPVDGPPVVSVMWGSKLDDVSPPPLDHEPYSQLVKWGLVQWSRARAREHVSSLLRSLASFEGRNEVTPDDARVLRELMRPMIIERAVLSKRDWEEGRDLNVGLLCLLTEFATHGFVTYEMLAVDYKIPEMQARGLLQTLNRYWTVEKNSPPKFLPNAETVKLLEQVQPKLTLTEAKHVRRTRGIGDKGR